MFKKLMTAAVLATTLAGASLVSAGTAEARYGRNGAFAAGAVLGLVGGAILADSYGGGYAPVHYRRSYGYCFWKKRWVHDYYGWRKIRVRVCR